MKKKKKLSMFNMGIEKEKKLSREEEQESHKAPSPDAHDVPDDDKSQGNNYYIFCQDLFKIYKIAELEVVALRGLDIKIESGELMAIIGASGSGKTTLLNILGGLDKPSAGKVTVGEKDLLHMTPHDLINYRRHDIGFVWQQVSRNLVPYLTAIHNVEMPLMLLGWSPRKRKQRAEELMEAVGLADRMRYHPERLSGGEQQRVAIAVALAQNPPLLLADEPTGELDTQTAATIFEIFRALNKAYGITIVVVTHDIRIMNEVNRIVTIRDGRTSLEAIRSPENVLNEFVVLDTAGRLQLPREYQEKLGLKERVKVNLLDDHITVWNEQNAKGGQT